MFLLIDWGNTRIKYLLVEDQDILRNDILSQPLRYARSSDELFTNVLAATNKQLIKAVLMASVRDNQDTQKLSQKFKELGAKIYIAGTSAMNCGIKCAYVDYSSLGVDRWLAVIGAYSKSHNIGVIDAGSALTVDLVSSEGLHLGGHILPGKRLLRDSLLKTDQVRAGETITATSNFELGRSTAECVDFGIQQMMSGYLKSVIQQAKTGYSVEDWIVTGGDGLELVEQLTKYPTEISQSKFQYQPTIVFKGLVDLYFEMASGQ